MNLPRRTLLRTSALTASWMLARPSTRGWAGDPTGGKAVAKALPAKAATGLTPLATQLLADWCDGLLRTQINQLQALGPVVQGEDALELDRWVASLPRPVLVPVPPVRES